MFAGGPQYLSAAVLYENMVIESYDKEKYQLPFPVVAIYPKEGTFWSDHPVGIVDREWVTEEHREAAEKYIEFLLAEEQQKRAMEFGFRPAIATIPLEAPVDTDHGIDPKQPKTTLEVPSAAVMEEIIALWKKNKKHANIVLVLDTSGSMGGPKIANAKQGATMLIDMLGDEDQLSLLPFNSDVRWVAKGMKMEKQRAEAKRQVNTYFAGGGTALYRAVEEASKYLEENPTPKRISAIVVLSDGEDTDGGITLNQLLDQIRTDNEAKSTRIFTIGYETSPQEEKVLEEISESTKAKFFEGTQDNIRDVFRDISTFF